MFMMVGCIDPIEEVGEVVSTEMTSAGNYRLFKKVKRKRNSKWVVEPFYCSKEEYEYYNKKLREEKE